MAEKTKLSEIEGIIEAVFRRGYYHGVSEGKSNDGETKTVKHFVPILKRKFVKWHLSKQLTKDEWTVFFGKLKAKLFQENQ